MMSVVNSIFKKTKIPSDKEIEENLNKFAIVTMCFANIETYAAGQYLNTQVLNKLLGNLEFFKLAYSIVPKITKRLGGGGIKHESPKNKKDITTISEYFKISNQDAIQYLSWVSEDDLKSMENVGGLE